jgi:hypothetical protein
MQVRQAALLILDGPDRAAVATEDLLPLKVVQEVVQLHVERARDRVGAVRSPLARQQLAGDLVPLRVGRKRDEETRTAELAHDRHRILEALAYESGAAKVTGWQDHAAACGGQVDVGASESVGDTVVEVGGDVRLVRTEPIQLVLIANDPGVNQVLLEEAAVRQGDQLVAATDVQVEAEVLAKGEPVPLAVTMEPQLVVPAMVSVRKKQHVVQRHVGGVGRVDAVAARSVGGPAPLRQDDVAAAGVAILVRDDRGNLVAGGQVLAAAVSALFEHQAHLGAEDDARRPRGMLTGPQPLPRGQIQPDVRVIDVVEHVQQTSQDGTVQLGVGPQASIRSVGLLVDEIVACGPTMTAPASHGLPSFSSAVRRWSQTAGTSWEK